MNTPLRIFLFFIFALTFLLISPSCMRSKTIYPKGDIKKEQRVETHFSELTISRAIDVFVKVDSLESIVVEAAENIIPYVKIFKRGDALFITRNSDFRYGPGTDIRVYISVKELKTIDISGASSLKAEPLNLAHLTVKSSGASDVFFEYLQCNTLSFDLSGASDFTGDVFCQEIDGSASGASDVNLKGSIDQYRLLLSGASGASGYDASCLHFTGKLSGASQVEASVSQSISISASGASSMYYKGDAAIISQSLSGGSKLFKH